MKKEKKTIRTNKGPREYTYLGCPLTRNRSAWCYRICGPDDEGLGRCGRIAPHGLRSRTQESIEGHKEKLLQDHCEKLEHLYLTAPSSAYHDPGVRIARGEAEIVIPIRDPFRQADGTVHPSICHGAMCDAAMLAVNSVVEDVLVRVVSFHIYMADGVQADELVAQGRFLGISGGHHLAEAVLTDSQGAELGRGNGAFLPGNTTLAADIGYQ